MNKNFKPLTFEDIDNFIEQIEKPVKVEGIEIKVCHALKGTQTVIKSGNNYYYSPDLREGEVKLIKVPPFEDILSIKTPLVIDYK